MLSERIISQLLRHLGNIIYFTSCQLFFFFQNHSENFSKYGSTGILKQVLTCLINSKIVHVSRNCQDKIKDIWNFAGNLHWFSFYCWLHRISFEFYSKLVNWKKKVYRLSMVIVVSYWLVSNCFMVRISNITIPSLPSLVSLSRKKHVGVNMEVLILLVWHTLG